LTPVVSSIDESERARHRELQDRPESLEPRPPRREPAGVVRAGIQRCRERRAPAATAGVEVQTQAAAAAAAANQAHMLQMQQQQKQLRR
jgi:hypothetical protein